MKVWTLFNATAVLSLTLIGVEGCPPLQAEQATHGSMPMGPGNGMTAPQERNAAFETLKGLVGKWAAPLPDNKTIVDTFRPFAFGTAILAEEWVDGQQVTSTVFYLVGSELRADHYCDYLNQPRYTGKPSADPSIIDLEFREATNLDVHPRHFHSTRWQLVDATHMTQDWTVEGGEKGKTTVHLAFVRQE
jgi:hypothetical protein